MLLSLHHPFGSLHSTYNVFYIPIIPLFVCTFTSWRAYRCWLQTQPQPSIIAEACWFQRLSAIHAVIFLPPSEGGHRWSFFLLLCGVGGMWIDCLWASPSPWRCCLCAQAVIGSGFMMSVVVGVATPRWHHTPLLGERLEIQWRCTWRQTWRPWRMLTPRQSDECSHWMR